MDRRRRMREWARRKREEEEALKLKEAEASSAALAPATPQTPAAESPAAGQEEPKGSGNLTATQTQQPNGETEVEVKPRSRSYADVARSSVPSKESSAKIAATSAVEKKPPEEEEMEEKEAEGEQQQRQQKMEDWSILSALDLTVPPDAVIPTETATDQPSQAPAQQSDQESGHGSESDDDVIPAAVLPDDTSTLRPGQPRKSSDGIPPPPPPPPPPLATDDSEDGEDDGEETEDGGAEEMDLEEGTDRTHRTPGILRIGSRSTPAPPVALTPRRFSQSQPGDLPRVTPSPFPPRYPGQRKSSVALPPAPAPPQSGPAPIPSGEPQGFPLCSQCQVQPSTVGCPPCSACLCNKCFKTLHKRKIMKFHKPVNLSRIALRKCGYCSGSGDAHSDTYVFCVNCASILCEVCNSDAHRGPVVNTHRRILVAPRVPRPPTSAEAELLLDPHLLTPVTSRGRSGSAAGGGVVTPLTTAAESAPPPPPPDSVPSTPAFPDDGDDWIGKLEQQRKRQQKSHSRTLGRGGGNWFSRRLGIGKTSPGGKGSNTLDGSLVSPDQALQESQIESNFDLMNQYRLKESASVANLQDPVSRSRRHSLSVLRPDSTEHPTSGDSSPPSISEITAQRRRPGAHSSTLGGAAGWKTLSKLPSSHSASQLSQVRFLLREEEGEEDGRHRSSTVAPGSGGSRLEPILQDSAEPEDPEDPGTGETSLDLMSFLREPVVLLSSAGEEDHSASSESGPRGGRKKQKKPKKKPKLSKQEKKKLKEKEKELKKQQKKKSSKKSKSSSGAEPSAEEVYRRDFSGEQFPYTVMEGKLAKRLRHNRHSWHDRYFRIDRLSETHTQISYYESKERSHNLENAKRQ